MLLLRPEWRAPSSTTRLSLVADRCLTAPLDSWDKGGPDEWTVTDPALGGAVPPDKPLPLKICPLGLCATPEPTSHEEGTQSSLVPRLPPPVPDWMRTPPLPVYGVVYGFQLRFSSLAMISMVFVVSVTFDVENYKVAELNEDVSCRID